MLVAAIVLAVVFGIVPLFYGVFAAARHQAEDIRNVFARLARKHNGSVHADGPFAVPTVQFDHRGAQVVVDATAGAGDAGAWTQCRIDWPETRLRMEVYPRLVDGSLRRLMGMKDVPIDDAAFRRRFIVTGNRVDEIVRLLDAPVRATILELASLQYDDQVYVAIQDGRLRVRKIGWIDYYSTLQRFVALCLQLFDQCAAGGAVDIQYLDGRLVRDEGQPICQICGEILASDLVWCAGCLTPHHRDCWQYFGSCSTYGCGVRSYSESPPG